MPYMDLDSILKASQSIFYIGGLGIAVLTYRRAKSTILNTVNTEYHKKVIEKLAELSDNLYKEFDETSDEVWYRQDDVGYVVDKLHEAIKNSREEIIASGKITSGIPVSPQQTKLINLAGKYKSDPFLPNQVRDKVVNLLERRERAIYGAHMTVIRGYMSELAEGKYWDTLETNKHWLHNSIVDMLRKNGVAVDDVEKAVHDIRLEIQRYFKKFNPVA